MEDENWHKWGSNISGKHNTTTEKREGSGGTQLGGKALVSIF